MSKKLLFMLYLFRFDISCYLEQYCHKKVTHSSRISKYQQND
jgi:hypothetical protein